MVKEKESGTVREDIKKLPYGMSNYGLIREKGYYYVDKTQYIEDIERAESYLFFIRPRRFGKSLLLAMMETYFDVYYKDRFEDYFKGTWIYDHPTSDTGQYLVLFLNFSIVDPDLDKVEKSFLNHVQGEAIAFLYKYKDHLLKNDDISRLTEVIKNSDNPSDILTNLFLICQLSNQKIYLIIDEYDNFSNTILSTIGKDAYHDLTHGSGFFRSFFNAIKAGTSRTNSPVQRSFITGVSPVTMDDVTSGYNIGKNVSLEPAFSEMVGFTRKDVIEMIEYYRSKGKIHHSTPELMALIDEWYGNYRFSLNESLSENDTLFNSDMILYFLGDYMSNNKIPNDLIDRNVRIDYGKLRHLIILDKGASKTTNGNFSKLKEVIETGGISTKLVTGFPLEELTSTVNFTSLLYYFGLLTIKGTDRDMTRLEIPNQTIKHLFYDYVKEAYQETGVFRLDLDKYSRFMTGMAYEGKWKPLFSFITEQMRENISLRDLITGEKSIQAFLNVYLGLSDLYIVHTERELNKGYADIFMEPFTAVYKGVKYAYLLEVKYINAGMNPEDNAVIQLRTAAEDQLKQYCIDEKFKKALEKTELIKLVLIFSGHEAVYIGEVG